MKIGILTFHSAYNYGAALQAYALQKTLEELAKGNEVEFIDYRPEYITKGYKNFNIAPFGIKTLLASLLLYCSRRKRHSKFFSFEREFLKLSDHSTLDGNISKNKYDAIVCGSDQIWNPKITQGFDETFFCDFVSEIESVKKITYAASFGVSSLSEIEKKQLPKLVNNFDYVSMRETEGVALIEKLYVKNKIVKTLDPTLLLDKKQWSALAIPPRQKAPYLLVYRMDGNDKLIEDAYFIARQRNLKVIEISYGKSIRKICSQRHEIITTIGPCEFIGLLKEADFVLTNSFHGTVFSIIFQKPFFSYPIGQLSSRMTTLLAVLGLNDRYVLVNGVESSFANSINYTAVEKLLRLEQNKSIEFLENALRL